MRAFTPTDAAFEGFRLSRERPRALAIWIGAYLVVQLLVAVLAISLGGHDLAVLYALSQTQTPDVHQVAALFQRLAPLFAVELPLEVGFQAIWTCAIYRAVLRPSEGGFGYFRLGMDELRMIALSVILFVMFFAGLMIVLFIVAVSSEFSASGNAFAALFGLASVLIAMGAAVWVFVRLTLAAPMTFSQRRLTVFRAWSLSQGHFWSILSAYVLALLLDVVVLVLMIVIATALISVAIVATGGSLNAADHAASAGAVSLGRFITLPWLLSQVLSAIMFSLLYVVILAPTAVVYRALADEPERPGSGWELL